MLWTTGSHKKEHIVFAAAKILNDAASSQAGSSSTAIAMFVRRTSERVLREVFGSDARNPPDLPLLGPDNRLLPDPDYPDTVFRIRSTG